MQKTLTISELTKMVNGRILNNSGDEGGRIIKGTCSIERPLEGRVTFIKKEKYIGALHNLKNTAVLIPEQMADATEKYSESGNGNVYIIVSDVTDAIISAQEFFYKDRNRNEDAKDVVIGEGTYIYPDTFIQDAVIGKNCLIHSGARIGNDGFRFAQVRKMYHAGKVIIGDNVEIGANTTIDRATFEGTATYISDDVKIDNLVHIAHNVTIGKRTCIAASSCICGSAVIGKDVWIGAGVNVSNGVRVGDRAKLLLNAVVAYDVAEDELMSGFYAMPHKQWKRVYNKLRKV
jgi:UDP-3-O-[3-hydroxymyristoyl] glucosamine N-acyltransferase